MNKEQGQDTTSAETPPQAPTDSDDGERARTQRFQPTNESPYALPDDSAPPDYPDITLIENEAGSYCPLNQVLMTPEQERHRRLRHLLFGRPLRTEETVQEKIGKRIGLTVFAPDILSSVAYATEEILYILILAGMAALHLSIPIAGSICILLVLVMLSYRQVTFAYPGGGGSYIVTRDNLGKYTAQVVGAALLADYVLTVAVSISAGVEQITSAFPLLNPHRVIISIGFIFLMSLINLRSLHVQVPRMAYAAPAYFFLIMALCMLGYGFWRMSQGTLAPVQGVQPYIQDAAQPLTMFLILRAFSSGSIALTGLEEISNRITAFKQPRSSNASKTILALSGLLMVLFMGITLLANHIHALPTPAESIISQLARTIFPHPAFYALMIAATTIILLMAANRSYAGFPRLAELQAEDGFMPHWLTLRGYRLAPSWGIVALSLSATVLIVAFQASVNALIPLYAVGVFLSFTLAQAGMVVHWQRVGRLKPGEMIGDGESVQQYHPRWRTKLGVNAVGCAVTALVTLVFVVTKFSHGAWVVILLMIGMVLIFFASKSTMRMSPGRFLWNAITRRQT